MCLSLNKDWRRALRTARNHAKPIKAYKIVLISAFMSELNIPKYFSPYEINFIWKIPGYNKSDRRYANLTKDEIHCWKVQKGFHFFRSIAAAKREIQVARFNSFILPPYHIGFGTKIIEVEIEPQDIIAVGRYASEQSIAAIKCKAIRIVK